MLTPASLSPSSQSNNSIGDAGAKALAEAIKEGHLPNLTQLDLVHPPQRLSLSFLVLVCVRHCAVAAYGRGRYRNSIPQGCYLRGWMY